MSAGTLARISPVVIGWMTAPTGPRRRGYALNATIGAEMWRYGPRQYAAAWSAAARCISAWVIV